MGLYDLQVLVTRPVAQADALSEMIDAAGGRAWRFPTLEIVPYEDLSAVQQTLGALTSGDIVIFITANAVKVVAAYWPENTATTNIAMGEATAKCMRENNIDVSIAPDVSFSSETLLNNPVLQQIDNKRIFLLMGENGREVLIEQLAARHAEVIKVPVYRRQCPEVAADMIAEFWQSQRPKIIIVTSVTSLQNLLTLVGNQIFDIPLLVVSERIKAAAIELGNFKEIIVTPKVSDQAILDTLIAWYPSNN